MKFFAITAAFLVALPAMAERLVTNPEMCKFDDPMDSHELGMELTSTEMFEIEYFCEIQQPVDIHWEAERTETRMGHCHEPGFVQPQLWTFQFSPYEPGMVRVWWLNADEPTEFQVCK